MSHWRRIEELEKKLPDVTAEQLQEVIRFRRELAQALQPRIRRLAMKRVLALENMLRQKQQPGDEEG